MTAAVIVALHHVIILFGAHYLISFLAQTSVYWICKQGPSKSTRATVACEFVENRFACLTWLLVPKCAPLISGVHQNEPEEKSYAVNHSLRVVRLQGFTAHVKSLVLLHLSIILPALCLNGVTGLCWSLSRRVQGEGRDPGHTHTVHSHNHALSACFGFVRGNQNSQAQRDSCSSLVGSFSY